MRQDSSPNRGRSPIAMAVGAVVEQLEVRLQLSTSVLSYHNDNASTGVNATEVQLTPANVKVGSFGKLFTVPLDGNVYAEPLVDAGVAIDGGVNTIAGAAGVHDVVFVATENDTLYAIDSTVAGGQILWKRSFLGTSNTGGDQNNTLGATSVTTVTSADVSSTDVSPTIGITGTPVIDPSTNILYVCVKTREVIGGNTCFVQRVHAINISDGTDAAAPFVIGKTTNGNTNTTPIYAYGAGDGHVTDPYNGTGKQVVQFNALHEAQRTALSLVNGTLYISWASHGDNGPYHGWVVTWDVSHVTSSGFKLTGVLCTSPNDGESGVWGGGGEISFEPDGSAFYFMTGNGTGGAQVVGANGLPTNANYNESVVKAVADPTTSPSDQNPNGWGLKVVDFFSPYNTAALDNVDSDFGSSEPLILPASAGIPGHPNLMIVGGKDGRVFLLDRDDLGGHTSTVDHALNSVLQSNGVKTAPVYDHGLLSSPAYFNGNIYVVSGFSGGAFELKINSNGTLSTVSQSAISSYGYLPGSPIVSANGTTNGIVWIMDRNLNEIHAYAASSLNTELWSSAQAVGGADNVGAVVKFATPTVANGEVYVGTLNSLVVYGLTPPAGVAPMAPVLMATALSGTSIDLNWTDSSAAPNNANGYLIEESTDDVHFTQITTAPAGAGSIAIGGLAATTKYYFRIRGYNGVGDSDYSNVANATTNAAVAAVDFSSGFTGDGGQFQLNGAAEIDGADLEVTDDGKNEAGSAFLTSPLNITEFDTQFEFQLTAGSTTADGFTFTLQNSAPTALGMIGGGLGYGSNTTGTTGGIPKSVAIKFDLYDNAGETPDSTGLYLNGAAPTSAGSIDLAAHNINLHSGDEFLVDLSYNGVTLTETIHDTTTGASDTATYTVNIAGIVGGDSAYAGFTGGTGGSVAAQNILNWTYSPIASVSPNAPSGLGAAPASAASVNLTWTNNATNQSGYHLDRATDAGFTQNLITETLPASPSAFTDVTTGLAPGGTYYYRLRATNAAGDSDNSNVASVTIPVAPPRPSNQQVDSVTTNQINISWTDNAGHSADGYKILRAVNHGSFVLIATLPPTSRAAPSQYTWSDTGLTPGSYYEYHIEAYNSSGNNDFDGVNATTVSNAPTSVKATPASNAVTLAWTAPAGAVTYNVYRGTTAGGESATPLVKGITTATYKDTTAKNGTKYYYKVTAVNANATAGYVPALASESARSAEVSATPGTTAVTTRPYGGKPAAFGTIQAENFDLGGQNVGYFDPGNVNSGGLYRRTEGVGIGSIPTADGGGYYVGWTKAGETLNYTVTVATTGTYTLNFRVSSNGPGGNFHLNVDGKNVTGTLTVPNTANWNVYKIVSKTGVALTAGTHVLQLVIDSIVPTHAAGNFDWIQAVKTA